MKSKDKAHWIPLNTEQDWRGRTDAFECSKCGSLVKITTKDTYCHYPHCPFCAEKMMSRFEQMLYA